MGTGSRVGFGIQRLPACARALGIELKDLQAIADTADSLYRTFPDKKRKKNGEIRVITAPCEALKKVQRKIDRRLLRKIAPSGAAFGGVPNRSHLMGASKHEGQNFVACLDVRDCFPSITHRQVYRFLVGVGYSPDVSRLLTRLLTRHGAVPQGSPASPTLANLILAAVDEDLLQHRGVSVSRVVDDIALSGQRKDVLAAVGTAFSSIRRNGLRVHRGKLMLQPATSRQRVTNLVVNRRIGLPRESYEQELSRKGLRDEVRRVGRYGATEKERRSLEGKLRYLKQLHPKRANGLLGKLALAPTVAS